MKFTKIRVVVEARVSGDHYSAKDLCWDLKNQIAAGQIQRRNAKIGKKIYFSGSLRVLELNKVLAAQIIEERRQSEIADMRRRLDELEKRTSPHALAGMD